MSKVNLWEVERLTDGPDGRGALQIRSSSLCSGQICDHVIVAATSPVETPS